MQSFRRLRLKPQLDIEAKVRDPTKKAHTVPDHLLAFRGMTGSVAVALALGEIVATTSGAIFR